MTLLVKPKSKISVVQAALAPNTKLKEFDVKSKGSGLFGTLTPYTSHASRCEYFLI
ncbi:hypothetical protein [Nostoc sp.]|uniref:hypothetical protein n=1 Tax=Nostoc sp. TaxID=1180 RepID=UPI002FF90702